MDTIKHIFEKFHVDPKECTPANITCNRLTDLPDLFKELGFTSGAEIGVLGGVYSEVLCQSNPAMQIFSIDAWEYYPVYKDFRKPKHYPAIYEDAKNRLSKYPNSTIIRKWSLDAVKDFEDESLDFVFIDGDHRFEAVTNDIAQWSKKVRKGGIVSGHDYGVRRHEFVHVTDVVDAWTKSHKISPWFILNGPEGAHDTGWMWVKN